MEKSANLLIDEYISGKIGKGRHCGEYPLEPKVIEGDSDFSYMYDYGLVVCGIYEETKNTFMTKNIKEATHILVISPYMCHSVSNLPFAFDWQNAMSKWAGEGRGISKKIIKKVFYSYCYVDYAEQVYQERSRRPYERCQGIGNIIFGIDELNEIINDNKARLLKAKNAMKECRDASHKSIYYGLIEKYCYSGNILTSQESITVSLVEETTQLYYNKDDVRTDLTVYIYKDEDGVEYEYRPSGTIYHETGSISYRWNMRYYPVNMRESEFIIIIKEGE